MARYLAGRGVKLEGLGTYAPKIGLYGKFGVTHRLDTRIKNELNATGAFDETILNRTTSSHTDA